MSNKKQIEVVNKDVILLSSPENQAAPLPNEAISSKCSTNLDEIQSYETAQNPPKFKLGGKLIKYNESDCDNGTISPKIEASSGMDEDALIYEDLLEFEETVHTDNSSEKVDNALQILQSACESIESKEKIEIDSPKAIKNENESLVNLEESSKEQELPRRKESEGNSALSRMLNLPGSMCILGAKVDGELVFVECLVCSIKLQKSDLIKHVASKKHLLNTLKYLEFDVYLKYHHSDISYSIKCLRKIALDFESNLKDKLQIVDFNNYSKAKESKTNELLKLFYSKFKFCDRTLLRRAYMLQDIKMNKDDNICAKSSLHITQKENEFGSLPSHKAEVTQYNKYVLVGSSPLIEIISPLMDRLPNFHQMKLCSFSEFYEINKQLSALDPKERTLFFVAGDVSVIRKKFEYTRCSIEKCARPVFSCSNKPLSHSLEGVNHLVKLVRKNAHWQVLILPLFPVHFVSLASASKTDHHHLHDSALLVYLYLPCNWFLASQHFRQKWKELVTDTFSKCFTNCDKFRVFFDNDFIIHLRQEIKDLEKDSLYEEKWKTHFSNLINEIIAFKSESNLDNISSELNTERKNGSSEVIDVDYEGNSPKRAWRSSISNSKPRFAISLFSENDKDDKGKVLTETHAAPAPLPANDETGVPESKNRPNMILAEKDVGLELLPSIKSDALNIFDKIYVIGKHFIPQSCFLNYDVIRITYDINGADVGDISSIKMGLNPSSKNAACLLLYDMDLIFKRVTNATNGPKCSKSNCSLSIEVSQLEKKLTDQNCEPKDIINGHIAKVISFVDELSKVFPTLIAPLFPKVAFFCDQERKLPHEIAHISQSKYTSLIFGEETESRAYLGALQDAWNLLMKCNYEMFSAVELVTKLSSKVRSIYLPYSNLKEICSHQAEIDVWKETLVSLMGVFAKDKIQPNLESRSKESSTSDQSVTHLKRSLKPKTLESSSQAPPSSYNSLPSIAVWSSPAPDCRPQMNSYQEHHPWPTYHDPAPIYPLPQCFPIQLVPPDVNQFTSAAAFQAPAVNIPPPFVNHQYSAPSAPVPISTQALNSQVTGVAFHIQNPPPAVNLPVYTPAFDAPHPFNPQMPSPYAAAPLPSFNHPPVLPVNHNGNNSASQDSGHITVEVSNMSKMLPISLFEELARRFELQSTVDGSELFDRRKISIRFKSVFNASKFVKSSGKVRIADCVLRVSLVSDLEVSHLSSEELSLGSKTLGEIVSKYRGHLADNILNKLNEGLDVSSYKVYPCGGCKERARCMKYHSKEEQRRNPFIHPYSEKYCPILKNGLNCLSGVNCLHSHNDYEWNFNPFAFQTLPCPDGQVGTCPNKPFCRFAHKDTPEFLFTYNWQDEVKFGYWNSFWYLAGAIRGRCKLRKIFEHKILFMSSDHKVSSLAYSVIRNMAEDYKLQAVLLDKYSQEELIWKFDVILGTYDALFKFFKVLMVQEICAVIVDDAASFLKDFSHCSHLFQLFNKRNLTEGNFPNKIFVVGEDESSDIFNSIYRNLKVNIDEKAVPATSHSERHFSSWDRETSSTSSKGPRSKFRSWIHSQLSPVTYRSRLSSPSRSRSPPSNYRSRSPPLNYRSSPSMRHRQRSRSPFISRRSRSKSRSPNWRIRLKSRSRSRSPVPDSRHKAHPTKPDYASKTLRRKARSRSKSRSRTSATKTRSPRSPARRISKPASRSDSSSRKDKKKAEKSASRKKAIESRFGSQSNSESKQKTILEESRPTATHSAAEISPFKKRSIPTPEPCNIDLDGKPMADYPHKVTSDKAKEAATLRAIQMENEIQRKLDEEYNLYKDFPEVHPDYEKHYSHFVEKSEEGSEKEKKKRWKKYWKDVLEVSKTRDYKENLKELLIKPNPESANKPSTARGVEGPKVIQEEFSISGTLDLLEQLEKQLGIVGSALMALVKENRSKGIDTPAALKPFSDPENEIVFQIAQNLFKEKLQLVPANCRAVFERAAEWTEKLVAFAKQKVSQKHVELDVRAIATATLGKSMEYTLDFIKTALLYEGVDSPSSDKICDIFLKVGALHHSMSS